MAEISGTTDPVDIGNLNSSILMNLSLIGIAKVDVYIKNVWFMLLCFEFLTF